ncbi:MAG: YqaJ viral recombinase family protein [Alphaproteobacteria bacterium]|nr:YqaJ viral recombinase family protein [Alphaproteobacteria bacterium]
MRIVEHQQGSDAWKLWRSTRRMASEAAVIMGAAPKWMAVNSWEQLRLAKAGLADYSERDEAMFRHGHEREAQARAALEAELCRKGAPACVESDCGRYGASLDWLDKYRTVFAEIKCPTSQAKWHHGIESWDDIPAHYQWQMMHQSMVTGIDDWIFFVWSPNAQTLIRCNTGFDINFYANKLKIARQWERFDLGLDQGRNDNEWIWWADEWGQRKAVADEAAKSLKEARDKLVELAGGEEAEGMGVRVGKAKRTGGYDTAAMAKALVRAGVDPEQFHKPETEFWTVRETAK